MDLDASAHQFPLELSAQQVHFPHMPLFTAENAATMAKRRWEAEREREEQPRILAANTDDKGLSGLANRTREHIDAIDKLIDDCTDAREMDALTRSREREWRIYAHLANLPGPGNLKPASPRSRSTQAPPIPQPVVVQPTEPKP